MDNLILFLRQKTFALLILPTNLSLPEKCMKGITIDQHRSTAVGNLFTPKKVVPGLFLGKLSRMTKMSGSNMLGHQQISETSRENTYM